MDCSHPILCHDRSRRTPALALQFDSDDEVAAEEEEEAMRLQREQAGKLDSSHFCLAGEEADDDGDNDNDDVEDGDGEDASLGGAAAVRGCLWRASLLYLSRVHPTAIITLSGLFHSKAPCWG